MEERVHPIPFRTRKLSSPSPMILHNVMWESRPLSTIAPKPLAAHSARGFVFSPSLPYLPIFPFISSLVLAYARPYLFPHFLPCLPHLDLTFSAAAASSSSSSFPHRQLLTLTSDGCRSEPARRFMRTGLSRLNASVLKSWCT